MAHSCCVCRLKAIEKQEHDYLARVAQQNAHKPQPAVRKKDPEKYPNFLPPSPPRPFPAVCVSSVFVCRCV